MCDAFDFSRSLLLLLPIIYVLVNRYTLLCKLSGRLYTLHNNTITLDRHARIILLYFYNIQFTCRESSKTQYVNSQHWHRIVITREKN